MRNDIPETTHSGHVGLRTSASAAAVEAFVAGAVADHQFAADVAGGGVGLGLKDLAFAFCDPQFQLAFIHGFLGRFTMFFVGLAVAV